MISDSSYIEILKNCSKWNSRTVCGKKRSYTAIFDQQTGVVQRPTEYLYRHYTERCAPRLQSQVCAYPANTWKKSKEISSDSCEMKYFLNISPALNEAFASLANPNNIISTENNFSSFDQSNMSMRSLYSKYDMSEIDISEYDIEGPENDPSDEDDWGSSKKRRKKNATSTPKPRRNASAAGNASSSGNANGGNGTQSGNNGTPTPFVCQICGAKYKSRPGLTYHRVHVHQDGQPTPRNNANGANGGSHASNSNGNNATSASSTAITTNIIVDEANTIPKSPIVRSVAPAVQASSTCDFCLGDKSANVNGKAEDLVSCHDCGRSGHPSCLKFTANMLTSTKRYGWQCIECKSCAVCGTSEHDDQLLFCDDCDRGFHLYCLNPPLKKPPDTDWSCDLCQNEYGERSSIMMAKAKLVSEKIDP